MGNTDAMRARRVDIVDETFIAAPPQVVRQQLDDERWAASVWPHLSRTVVRDRGLQGVRWSVSGQVEGEMEVWIEPFWDGAVVHHYVRGRATRGAPRNLALRHTMRWKRAVHALKDRLEGNSL